MTYRNVVAPAYFQLMRIPIMEGRDFTEHDDEKSAPAMIVNQSFVKRYLDNGMVLGRPGRQGSGNGHAGASLPASLSLNLAHQSRPAL